MPVYLPPVTDALFDFGLIPSLADVGTFTFELNLFPTSVMSISQATVTGLLINLEATPIHASYFVGQATLFGTTTPILVDTVVGSSVLVAPDVFPTDVTTETWESSNFFIPNWTTPVSVQNRYKTKVSTSDTGKESRIGLTNTPYRSLKFSLLAMKSRGVTKFEAQVKRNGTAKTLMPLWTDELFTLSPLTPADSFYLTDITKLGRLSVGGYVLLVDIADGHVTQHEVLKVSGLTTNLGISFETPPTQTFPVGSRLVPILEVEAALEQSFQVVAAQAHTMSVSADEVVGTPSLLNTQPANTIFSGDWKVYKGLPVFHYPKSVDSYKENYNRPGQDITIGIGRSFNFNSPEPIRIASLDLVLLRDEMFKLIRFFDSRRGRLHSFWYVSHAFKFMGSTIDTTAGTVTMPSIGEVLDWSSIKNLALIEDTETRTPYIIDVVSFSRVGGQDTFSFTSVENLAGKSFVGLTWAYKARLESDSLAEIWLTHKVCRASIVVRELLL